MDTPTTNTEETATPEEAGKAAAPAAASAPKKTNQQKYVRTAKGKRRIAKKLSRGKAYVHASVNNTIISVTDQNGNVVAWSSAGNCGFRGPKKATPYAASMIVNKIAEQLAPLGMKELQVIVKGIGNGRDASVRSLNAKGFNIVSVKEVTPIPHNGCRARRPRRV